MRQLESRQDDLDNHANQMNPNNDAYWQSRGEDDRPDDWEERAEQDETEPGEGPRAARGKETERPTP